MAKFGAVGIEGLSLSFEEFAKIPDDVIDEMLKAESKVVVAAHKRSLRSLGLMDSGKLEASISAHHKVKNQQRYVLVYPEGTHHKYNGVEETKTYARSTSGRTYTTGGGTKTATNNDVGFVHEFGAPSAGIKASQWMRKANESCGDEVEKAALSVYDEWLKSINL